MGVARWLTALCLTCSVFSLAAQPIRVAVASNFKSTLEVLITEYRQQHPQQQVLLSSASSGVLYNQIVHGAPFDIFLSADEDYAKGLVDSGLAQGYQVYARGRLAWWCPSCTQQVKDSDLANFAQGFNGTLAIANPKLAPYGKAAEQVIAKAQLKPRRTVLGNNISQTYQFVATRTADAGLVALSLLLDAQTARTEYRIIDTVLHQDIAQGMSLLSDNEQTMAFYRYLSSEQARQIIRQAGYY